MFSHTNLVIDIPITFGAVHARPPDDTVHTFVDVLPNILEVPFLYRHAVSITVDIQQA